MGTKKARLNLSVRKSREYQKLMHEQKEIGERVKALELLGTADTNALLDKGAKEIGMALSKLPESLKRKAMHLATVMFIPKSPRGRKPSKHHAHAAA